MSKPPSQGIVLSKRFVGDRICVAMASLRALSTRLVSRAKRSPGNGTAVQFDWVAVCALMLITVHCGIMAVAASLHCPSLNEPGHLSAGVYIWEFGRFGVYRVNPPLVRVVAAAPIRFVGSKANWDHCFEGPLARPEFQVGADFIAANGEQSFLLFTLARWACIPFSLIGAAVCLRWAGKLYGHGAGVFALTLWCFCPNIIAYGSVITPDVAATSLGLAACYTFWLWLREPTWTRTLVSGLVLGLAELAKMTLVIFFALWPLMWLVYRLPSRKTMTRRDWTREVGMIGARMLVAVYILNLGYGFEGSLTPLSKFQFVSATLRGTDDSARPVGNRFADSWLGYAPVPLPKNYLLGMDLQKHDFEEYHSPSYLRGQFSPQGWWYYYLYALAIKVPLGTWFLVCLAAVVGHWAKAKVRWRDEFILLCPAVVILIFVSSQTGFSEHIRYVLPAFPFAFIWISRASVIFNRHHYLLATVASVALVWSISSSLWVYPHSLSYFNELTGGPLGGPKHLIHSNVDWGQDLLYLKRWLDKHPEARPLKLAYFGNFDPIHAGIEYTAPGEIPMAGVDSSAQPRIPPGWYAISVNFVRGLPFFIYRGDGTKVLLEQNALAAFQQLSPVAMAGYSIYIYHVE